MHIITWAPKGNSPTKIWRKSQCAKTAPSSVSQSGSVHNLVTNRSKSPKLAKTVSLKNIWAPVPYYQVCKVAQFCEYRSVRVDRGTSPNFDIDPVREKRRKEEK